MKGIDCATPPRESTALAMAGAGMQFVCRYLVPKNCAWKRLTRSGAELITAALLGGSARVESRKEYLNPF